MSSLLKKSIILILVVFFTSSGFSNQQNDSTTTMLNLSLEKPPGGNGENNSADGLHFTIQEKTDIPLIVRVLQNDSIPVANYPVEFSIVSFPSKSKGTNVETVKAITNEDGIAETYVFLGSKQGVYEFSARIFGSIPKKDIAYFKLHGRKSNWVFFLIVGLLGGLAIFLFGMEMMSEGMKKTAGSRLRSILSSITNNRLVAVGVGTFVTMVIQSSSATTVMLVSFVQARLMTFSQSLGIILGADIGTTITAQLIAFKLTDYALLMVGFGFGLIFLIKSQKYKNIGETILGFGLLFFGMHIMSDAMYPLRTYTPFIQLLLQLENPLFGLLIGTIFTALIQSSSAFTGIIIILASQGLLTLEAGIPLLFGANIGTSITAALASLNTGREAKRVALAHTLFKVFGVALFVWWIPYFAEIIRWISPSGSADITGVAHLAEVVPRQVANAHTVFNVALTILVLPFTNMAANWIIRIFPDLPEKEEDLPYKTRFLDESLISTPALALNLAKVEVLRVGKKTKEMATKIIQPFFKDKQEILNEIDVHEDEINFLVSKINNYLTKISQEEIDEEEVDNVFQMMHTVTELEQIADIVVRNIVPMAHKRINLNCRFSAEGEGEILDYHSATVKQLSRALDVFKDVNLEEAVKLEKKYKKHRLREMGLRRTHFQRLQKDVPETISSSEIHVDLIEALKRISSHATNIARILIEWENSRIEERKTS